MAKVIDSVNKCFVDGVTKNELKGIEILSGSFTIPLNWANSFYTEEINLPEGFTFENAFIVISSLAIYNNAEFSKYIDFYFNGDRKIWDHISVRNSLNKTNNNTKINIFLTSTTNLAELLGEEIHYTIGLMKTTTYEPIPG